MSNYTLEGIPSEAVVYAWPRTAELAQKVADRSKGNLSVELLLHNLMEQDMQLWHIVDGTDFKGIVVTEFETRPDGGTTCFIVACAGVQWAMWAHLLAELEHWAKESGADRMATWGRKGWAKKLTDYKISRTEYTKDL